MREDLPDYLTLPNFDRQVRYILPLLYPDWRCPICGIREPMVLTNLCSARQSKADGYKMLSDEKLLYLVPLCLNCNGKVHNGLIERESALAFAIGNDFTAEYVAQSYLDARDAGWLVKHETTVNDSGDCYRGAAEVFYARLRSVFGRLVPEWLCHFCGADGPRSFHHIRHTGDQCDLRFIVALCMNCHWKADRGKFTIRELECNAVGTYLSRATVVDTDMRERHRNGEKPRHLQRWKWEERQANR